MDFRAFRPRTSENVAAPVHQRHKSTGNLIGMASASAVGFLRPAKRAAFGDVTNTTRTSTNAVVGKAGILKPQPAVLPSQPVRPATAKGYKENATQSSRDILAKPRSRSIATTTSILKPRPTNHSLPLDVIQPLHDIPRVPHRLSESAVPLIPIPQQQPPQDNHSLQPRHHKSQPQLKQQKAPILRKTQSKQFDMVEMPSGKLQDTLSEVPEVEIELPNSSKFAAVEVEQASGKTVYVDSVSYPGDGSAKASNIPNYPEASVPSTHTSALSEPEEYWDEEDEDFDDQDQAYTTAHSFRSRDLTSGNVTTMLAPRLTSKVQRELEDARCQVEANLSPDELEEEFWDVTMVAEYGDEIFEYLRELEIKMLPNPYYMENQTEIQWSMRSVLMDWLVQVHGRFNLLPETLFLTVNYIDRFLSSKVVSVGKLQLVGATAILVAAKYEEIHCPSLEEIEFMVDNGYTTDEILKAERFMLSMLGFELGWPGPMSFLRRVSKADNYDLDTRTLAKYFLELTIMDERFIATPPSFLAAGAHCLSRFILKKGDWSKEHVYYSGYTWTQLRPLVTMIIECCSQPRLHHASIFEKYCDKRFKEAALIVQDALDAGFTLPSNQAPVRPRHLTMNTHMSESTEQLHNLLAAVQSHT